MYVEGSVTPPNLVCHSLIFLPSRMYLLACDMIPCAPPWPPPNWVFPFQKTNRWGGSTSGWRITWQWNPGCGWRIKKDEVMQAVGIDSLRPFFGQEESCEITKACNPPGTSRFKKLRWCFKHQVPFLLIINLATACLTSREAVVLSVGWSVP